jgi:hypothetical protein
MARRKSVVVVDSDVLIQVLRGDLDTAAALKRNVESGVPIQITPVAVVEVLAGARPNEEARTRGLLDAFPCVRIDRAVAERAASYLARFSASHGVEPMDTLVAACASAQGARLWTFNRKHYPMRDLKLFSGGRG